MVLPPSILPFALRPVSNRLHCIPHSDKLWETKLSSKSSPFLYPCFNQDNIKVFFLTDETTFVTVPLVLIVCRERHQRVPFVFYRYNLPSSIGYPS